MFGILGDSPEALCFAALLKKKKGISPLVLRSKATLALGPVAVMVDFDGGHTFTENIESQNFDFSATERFWFIFDAQLPWAELKGPKVFVVSNISQHQLRPRFGALCLNWKVERKKSRQHYVRLKSAVEAVGPGARRCVDFVRGMDFSVLPKQKIKKTSSWKPWAISLET